MDGFGCCGSSVRPDCICVMQRPDCHCGCDLCLCPEPPHCVVCEDFKVLPRLHAGEPVCTCGAGPLDELTMHDITCDTVPCPFCDLEDVPWLTAITAGF
jgi:hypothetical protein